MSNYKDQMPVYSSHRQRLPRHAACLLLLALGSAISGCAEMSDGVASAFADPAKYDLYDCKQLETERKSLTAREKDLQRLMAKAETGVAGSVVSELAYRNDYIAVRGQTRLAEEAWQKNKCQETPAAVAAPVVPTVGVKGARAAPRSKGAVN